MEPDYLVVLNPKAGNGRSSRIASKLFSYLTDKGLSFEVIETFGGLRKNEKIKSFSRDIHETIVIGGDGTLNEVINASNLDHSIISIIPAGTGNDFQKNIKIGASLKERFETIINGVTMKIDVGSCNDYKFINGVGVGFDGQIVWEMLNNRTILNGHAAYYYHVIKILSGYREKSFSYLIDNTEVNRKLILLTIANGTTFGGGFRLTPHAKLDDGKLAVCEIGKLSPKQRFLNLHRLKNGSHNYLKTVNFYSTERIIVNNNEPGLVAHIDGELLGEPPFNIGIIPRKLKVRVQAQG